MPTTSSRDAARAAFEKLDTSEKSAFILEATFNTIGQALEETGRRVADIFESFDVEDLFTQESEEKAPAEPEEKKAAPRKKAANPPKKPASRAEKATPPSKTAGKPKTTDDDEA